MTEIPIDCEALLDRCWNMLNRKYEEAYGQRNYGYRKPRFTFVLSAEQIRALQKYAVDMKQSSRVFMVTDKQTLFGHPIIAQKRTPYLEVII